MIAAPQGKWFARVESEGEDEAWGDEPTFLEVIAWDGEGHALVIDFTGGCLKRANEVKGFERLATAFERDAETSAGRGEEEDDEDAA
ncbi:hypothetical protein ACWCRF_07220 [Streptomyces sp. NPDC002405]